MYLPGPMAHLFHGVHEQTHVPFAIAYSLCIGPYATDCRHPKQHKPINDDGTTASTTGHSHNHNHAHPGKKPKTSHAFINCSPSKVALVLVIINYWLLS